MHCTNNTFTEEDYAAKFETMTDQQLYWYRQSDPMEAYFSSIDSCLPNSTDMWPPFLDNTTFDATFSWPPTDYIGDVKVISPASLMQNSACASPVSGGIPSLCDTDTASPEYHSGNVTPVLIEAAIHPISHCPLTSSSAYEQPNGWTDHALYKNVTNSHSISTNFTKHDVNIWPLDTSYRLHEQPTRTATPIEVEKTCALPNTPTSLRDESSSCVSSRRTSMSESKPSSPTITLKRRLSDVPDSPEDDLESDFGQDDEEDEQLEDDDDDEDMEDDEDDDGSDEYDDTLPTKRKTARIQNHSGSKKTRKNYTKDITRILMNWYLTNNGLLPDQETKTRLAGLTNKTPVQISTWYQNARRRHHLKLKRYQTLHAQNSDVVYDYESLMTYLKEQKGKHAKRPQDAKRSRRRYK